MIQRIQTVYLFITGVLMIIMAFLPLAELMISGGEIVDYYSYGLRKAEGASEEVIYSTWPVTLLIGIISLISFIAIFSYKNRIRQIRLCIFNILLLVGLIGMVVFYYFTIDNEFEILHHTFRFSTVIPVVSIVLLIQAFRGIRKDELLVKSYERLR